MWENSDKVGVRKAISMETEVIKRWKFGIILQKRRTLKSLANLSAVIYFILFDLISGQKPFSPAWYLGQRIFENLPSAQHISSDFIELNKADLVFENSFGFFWWIVHGKQPNSHPTTHSLLTPHWDRERNRENGNKKTSVMS